MSLVPVLAHGDGILLLGLMVMSTMMILAGAFTLRERRRWLGTAFIVGGLMLLLVSLINFGYVLRYLF